MAVIHLVLLLNRFMSPAKAGLNNLDLYHRVKIYILLYWYRNANVV